MEVFIRDGNGNVLDDNSVLNKTSGLVEFWSGSQVYSETLSWSGRLNPGTYEVGLRVTASSDAFGTTAITDIHRNKDFPNRGLRV